MKVLDLFSGVGGFSLGLERCGMHTVAFCEVDKKCRQVLKKHWPDVPIYDDVRKLTYEQLKQDGISEIDLIAGGFPCQDISLAGQGAGITGTRSGLWTEFARLIGEIRPRYAIVENVSALLGRGLDRVLGDLASLGYDAQWHCIPACAVGAPHQRDRVWIVANARYRARGNKREIKVVVDGLCRYGRTETMADTNQKESSRLSVRKSPENSRSGICGEDVSCPDSERCEKQQRPVTKDQRPGRPQLECSNWWEIEPGVGRVVDGFPGRVDRLKGLGNAVVPQVVEFIGMAIMELNQ